MTDTYTKLFSSITASTVWGEPYATRVVWISMLAMADSNGCVYAAVPGLARHANVTLAEAEAALAAFMAPDPYSRTADADGRRIEAIDGGWRLLNHRKYRELRSAEERREYKRQWDRENRPSGSARAARQSDSSPTLPDKSPKKPDTPTPPAPAPEEKQQRCASPGGDAPGLSVRNDPIPYGDIAAAYNAAMEKLPKVRELTAKRRTLIRSAWQAAKPRQSLEFWRDYFAACADDPFLNGTGPYGNGHEGWRPGFDYLLRAEVVTRTVERVLDAADRGGRA